VIGIAAVSCSDQANGALCRNFVASGYPTVRVWNVLCFVIGNLNYTVGQKKLHFLYFW